MSTASRRRKGRLLCLTASLIVLVLTAFFLGNLVISAIAGGLTFAWLVIFSVCYAALLSIMVALFDLVPSSARPSPVWW